MKRFLGNFNGDEIFEYKFVIEKDLVGAFDSVGYYEGCFVELTGKMVNTIDVKTEVIQQAFGSPIEKKKTTIVKKNVVKSGSNPSTIYDVELTDELVEALKQRRVKKLEEIKLDVGNKQQNNNAFGKVAAPTQQAPVSPNVGYNPFAPKN